jgi:hypothetical protein
MLVIAMHRFHHQVDRGLQPLHAGFGIAEAVDQAGRVSDVREQDREMLALAALGCKGLQDTLRRLSRRRRRRGHRERIAAMSAEVAVAAADPPAAVTCNPKSGSAVLAKLVTELVLMTAIEELHGDRPCSTLVL